MSEHVQSSLAEYLSDAETEGCRCDACGRSFDSERGLKIHQTHVHAGNEEAECPTCGETFSGEHGLKIHRARAHGQDVSGTEFECEMCGGVARKPKHQIQNNEYNFCSDSCETEWREQRYSGEQNPNWDRVDVTCECCGGTESVAPYREDTFRFCSMECKAEWQSEHRSGEDAFAWEGGMNTKQCEECGEQFNYYPAAAGKHRFCSPSCLGKHREGKYAGKDNPSWQGGKATVVCEFCNNEYEVTPAKAEDSRFCSTDCLDDWRAKYKTGQNNHMWRGGSTIRDSVKKQLHGPSWRKIRSREIRNECRICGSGEDLHLHHIIALLDGGTNGAWNLMTLCQSCHKTAETFTRRFTESVLLPENMRN